MPFLHHLFGIDIAKDSFLNKEGLLLKGIDACLGVEGVPQSATGQTTLFTGINAAKSIGYHRPAFPNQALIKLINKASILKLAIENGLTSTFANAYTPEYFKMAERGLRTHSATTLCVMAADRRFRNLKELLKGDAIYWDITNQNLQNRTDDIVPLLSPYVAGERLAKLSRCYDLVLYECFLPDLIGHEMSMKKAVHCLETLDLFLKGIVENLLPEDSLVLTSDHGNMEDLSTGIHTKNPVPLLVSGPIAEYAVKIESLTNVTPAIISWLKQGVPA